MRRLPASWLFFPLLACLCTSVAAQLEAKIEDTGCAARGLEREIAAASRRGENDGCTSGGGCNSGRVPPPQVSLVQSSPPTLMSAVLLRDREEGLHDVFGSPPPAAARAAPAWQAFDTETPEDRHSGSRPLQPPMESIIAAPEEALHEARPPRMTLEELLDYVDSRSSKDAAASGEGSQLAHDTGHAGVVAHAETAAELVLKALNVSALSNGRPTNRASLLQHALWLMSGGSTLDGTTLFLLCLSVVLCCLPIVVMCLNSYKPELVAPTRTKPRKDSLRRMRSGMGVSSRTAAAAAARSSAAAGSPRTPNWTPAQEGYSEFVVPREWVCVLRMPRGDLSAGPYDILDPSGERVVHVPQAKKAALNTRESTHFFSFQVEAGQGATGFEEMAQCSYIGDRSKDADFYFHILRVPVPYHAKLSKSEGKYILETSAEKMTVDQTLDTCRTAIKNSAGKEVAVMEPDASNSSFYKVRLQPMTDVGLMLCALLCLSHVTRA